MGGGREILEGWKDATPIEAKWREVELVIEEYFDGYKRGTGSHVIIFSKEARELYLKLEKECGAQTAEQYVRPFNYKGEIVICLRSGKRVIKSYLDDLKEAISLQEKFKGFLKD